MIQRKMIQLLPGEESPAYSPLTLAPAEGFRWETDAELRARLTADLPDRKDLPFVPGNVTIDYMLIRLTHTTAETHNI